jgi:hypothetical protein
MLANRVLRTIFRPNSEKVTGYWRKLHNEERQNWYPHQIIFGLSSRQESNGRGMWQCKWEKRNAYGVFVGTPEGKRFLGRPRHKRENKIKTDLNEDGRTWTGLI